MTGAAINTGPAGALPGLWPAAPDAPLVVPVPGHWQEQTYQRDLRGLDPPLSPAFVVEHDTYYLGATRGGLLVTSRRFGPAARYSLAALTGVHPGTISGLRKPFSWRVGQGDALEFVDSVKVDNGPVVWLRTKGFNLFVPTPDPQRLADEIERRRWQVARLGSPRATRVWRAAPELRVSGPEGPQPASPKGPAAPEAVTGDGGRWTPLPLARPRVQSTTVAEAAPEPLADVPYPETVGDVCLPIRGSSPPLVVNVSNHRVRLSQQPLPAAPSPFLDPDAGFEEPRPYLTAPIVEFPVIRSGTLTGVPAGWSMRVLAPDARTEIRMDIVDGPAVWLWGMAHEWVLCTPYARQLAADLRQRRRIAALFPWNARHSIEFAVWHSYPDTELVETGAGWCLPPKPPYAPREPTIAPPGTWRSDPE